jgi:hypothetical protein
MPGSAAIGSRRSSANDFTLRRSIARFVVLTFMMLGILAVFDILNASAGGVAPTEVGIVTQIVPLEGFYQAESYHQDYAIHNPFNPYILVNDFPKVDRPQKQFPDLYVKNR